VRPAIAATFRTRRVTGRPGGKASGFSQIASGGVPPPPDDGMQPMCGRKLVARRATPV
jgi:hypothetical protein